MIPMQAARVFQFHKVRLKDAYNLFAALRCLVSIP